MKKVKLSDIYFAAANNHLCTNYEWDSEKSKYSCYAIAKAVHALVLTEVECLNCPASNSECYTVYNLTHWSNRAKKEKPTMYAALKFAKDNGCNIGSSTALESIRDIRTHQQVRYQWLMTLAMLAEEEGL